MLTSNKGDNGACSDVTGQTLAVCRLKLKTVSAEYLHTGITFYKLQLNKMTRLRLGQKHKTIIKDSKPKSVWQLIKLNLKRIMEKG